MEDRKQLTETIEMALLEALVNLHTATIAKVVGVDEKTIDVKPVINFDVNGESVAPPVFKEVPPLFMQGGASYTAHPIATGDYCLLIFTERCFDRWYSGQDNRRPAEYRMHDYSDGIVVVGVNPLSKALTIPTVITHIGDTYAQGNYEQVGNYDHTGNRAQVGDYVITGDLTVNGSVSVTAGAGDVVTVNGVTIQVTNGDVIADGISLKNHTHTGDSGGTTSPPNG